MNVALVYSSKTGNTKKIAQAIKNDVAEITAIASVDAVDFNVADFDTFILCYWVDKGDADAKSLAFYEQLSGKKIITVGTLGMKPETEHASGMRQKVKLNLEAKGNTVIGEYSCLGAIDPKLTEMFKQFPEGHPHFLDEARLKRHKDSQGHPDEADCAGATECVRKALANS